MELKGDIPPAIFPDISSDTAVGSAYKLSCQPGQFPPLIVTAEIINWKLKPHLFAQIFSVKIHFFARALEMISAERTKKEGV